MNITEQYGDIISGLISKTKEKKVIWNTTTDKDTFIVYFENFSLSVDYSYRMDYTGNIEEKWIAIELINNSGERIDRFLIEPDDAEWVLANELHTLARRSALSIDKAITEILTEISKPGVIGKKKHEDNSSSKDDFTDDIPF